MIPDPFESFRKNGFIQQPDGSWSKPAKGATAPAVVDVPRLSMQPIIRKTKDVSKLNKTETVWFEILKRRGFAWLGVQCVTLKLGDDCRYTPDFTAVTPEGRFIAYEVKGFMRDDALVKLKTAARSFPWITFILVRKEKSEFTEREINT